MASHFQSSMSQTTKHANNKSLNYVNKKKEAERIDLENKKIMSYILK